MNENIFLPEIVDLFSGCGGLAYGFKAAGFEIGHGIELIKAAADTASYNLYWKFGQDSEHFCGDITQISTDTIVSNCGNGFFVIGGPPCQAYSQIGRAKLRSLGEDRVHTNDSRGTLYQEFLRFSLGLNAKAIVMENVPEATNYGGLNIPQQVCEILEKNGYEAHWTILNAADYGVPQIRERAFVMAILRTAMQKFELPRPSHKNPKMKSTTNQMRFKKFAVFNNFLMPLASNTDLPLWVTVGDALSDLPDLFPSAVGKYKLHKMNSFLKYKTDPKNQFQQKMRNWDDQSLMHVSGNAFRKTERDFQIFERMKQGDDFRNASRVADEILQEECRIRAINLHDNPVEFEKLKKSIVPPYDRTKFHSKWRKLDESIPSHTVVAHLDTDTYSHIHPWEPRGISVREAARLQSFPDSFVFQCTMGDAFKQIGNAVPPLLAKAIAECMRENLVGG